MSYDQRQAPRHAARRFPGYRRINELAVGTLNALDEVQTEEVRAVSDSKRMMALPSEPAMRRFLEGVLPGRSPRILELRVAILHFAASPTARTVLIQGPIGAGKSTVARSIALLKRVAPLKADAAERIIGDARFDGANLLHLNSIPWYVELALTGLASELADVQLFGSVKGSFTDAMTRPGVFEQAMFGRRKRDDKLSEAVEMTGGVVFLDEVGDLIPAHQAKLLPVLSGGVFYRVGAEGTAGEELTFRGTVITASWKDLTGGVLRPDLLSRIGSNRLLVPGLSDRMDDFDEIVGTLERSVRENIAKSIDRITFADPYAAKDYWAMRRETIPFLSARDRERLARIGWSQHGNLRGLMVVVDQILARGLDVDEALAKLSPIESARDGADPTSGMLDDLRHRPPSSGGLARHVSELELQSRQALSDRLRSNPSLFKEIADRLRIPEEKLSYQVQQLTRTRRRSS